MHGNETTHGEMSVAGSATARVHGASPPLWRRARFAVIPHDHNRRGTPTSGRRRLVRETARATRLLTGTNEPPPSFARAMRA